MMDLGLLCIAVLSGGKLADPCCLSGLVTSLDASLVLAPAQQGQELLWVAPSCSLDRLEVMLCLAGKGH